MLLALGLGPDDAHASVRFSLGEDTSEADVDHVLAAVPQVVARLRALAGETEPSPGAGAAMRPA